MRDCRVGAYAGFGVSQTNGIIVTRGRDNYILSGNNSMGNSIGINDGGGPNKVVSANL